MLTIKVYFYGQSSFIKADEKILPHFVDEEST